MAQDSFDPTTALPVALSPSDDFDPSTAQLVPPTSLLRKAGDLGLSVAKGVIAVPEAAIGLLDIPTSGQVGKFLENEGGTLGVRPKQAKEYLSSLQSDDLQGKQREFQQADGIIDKTKAALSNPSLITNAVAESVPLMGAGAVPARAALAVAPKVGALAAGAIGEGVAGAGSAAEQVRQETADGLLTPKQAGLAAASGAATAAFGMAGGKLAQRLGIGDVDTMLAQGAAKTAGVPSAKSIPRQVVEGAISEGWLEELPQSVAEQILQNLALNKPWSEGVEDAAVMGTLAGMAMGGTAAGVAGFSGSDKPAAEQPQSTTATLTEAPAVEPTPAAPTLALPAPVINVAPDGSAITAADRNARLSRIAAGDVTDVTPIPAADPVREAVAAAAEQGGALSGAALTAIDSGAVQAAQPEQPTNEPRAISLEEADARDQAAYEQFFASLDTDPVVSRYFEDDTDIPDFGAASNVSDEEFLRSLGATDEDIQDAIATASQPSIPQSRPAVDAGAQANEPAGARQGAGADQAAQGQVAAAPAPSAPKNLRDGLARVRAQKQEAANAKAATPKAAPATAPISAAGPAAVEAAGVERSKLLASLEQAGATREMVLDARLKDAQYRLDQAIASPNINRADQKAKVLGLNQVIASLTDVRDQARALDERERREGSTRFMLRGARQELDAAVRAGAVAPEAAQSIASNAQKTGNAADASQAIFTAVDSSTEGATSEPQATQAVQASAQPAQAAAAPAAEPATAGASSPAAVGAPEVRALTDGTPAQNLGAQVAAAPGAKAAAPAGQKKALDRVNSGKAYYFSQAKAQAFVDDNGLRQTHEVVQDNKRFVVLAKPAADDAGDVRQFAPETGTLGIPRAEMPKVPAQSHGGLVKHLNAQGIDHETTMVDAAELKPTQAEFSPSKVEQAKESTGDRAVIVSNDGHIIDGHHQALAAAEEGKTVKAIVLDAPVERALEAVKNSPSAQAQPTEPAAQAKPAQAVNPRVPPENRALEIRSASEKEPWQMTALEFSQQEKGNPHWNQSYEGKDDGAYLADTAATHRRLVQEAIAAAPQKVADDFIPAPDGGLDYGEITPEMGKAMRRQAGKIRLRRGDETQGLVHIENRHAKDFAALGFNSAQDFVSQVASGFTKIYKGRGAALDVVLDDQARGMLIVSLEPSADGDFYDIKTATPIRRDQFKNEEPLWDRAGPSASTAGEGSPPYPKGQNGVDSVPPTATAAQPDTPKLTSAEAKSLMAWEDLGQKDGVKTHALTFYESEADKDAKRGRMIVAKVSKGDRSANNWMVEGDDKPLAVLGMAKKRAEEIGMAKAVADGFVEQGTKKPTVAATSGAPIEDFGQKIGGARKDVWSGFKDDLNKVMDDDIAGQPLAKVWPAPDYQKLIDAGMDAKSVAAVRALRDEVPAKPRAAWKVKRWAEQVKTLRGLANDVMDGKITVQDMERMGANKGTSLRGMMGRIELYELVGHGKSLEGVRFAEHHYTLYRGRENVNLWVVEKDAGASAFSNWPREIAIGDTKEQALAAFREKYDSLDLQNAVRKASFDIFSERTSNGFFIGKKIGRNYAKLEGPFATVKEAREYRQNNLPALEAKLEKYKEIPRERSDVNQPRVGVDMRNGQDVTPQMFSDVFGFRGVEFGNWVEQKRRQKDLNDAFDALMDMAAVLDIPTKAISLNGELGLAFGARGSGGVNPAAAHYEPDSVVINLTKKEGAGSLGHEWWHALDNYFAKQRKVNRGSFMTTGTDVGLAARGKDYYYEGGIRQEMIDAFGAVVKAINQTAMKARASKLDGKRTKEYWTTGEEMSARAFESYLISKLQDQNASNDYLANVVSEKTWDAMAALGMENDGSYPYPTAAEIPAIRAGFDYFFQTVETREDDAGNVAMFSRTRETQASYESRIDALFSGDKPRMKGARVLDRSDMVAFLGLGDGPVNLAEGKVIAGQSNHPHMTAAVWKQIPEWLENPAMVFDSDTAPGRLVFIAPELVNGSPVRIVVEPNAAGGANAHLLLNAYDAQSNAFRRWESAGLLRYVDRNKYAHVSGTFQPQLTGLPGDRGRSRILTDKQYNGYRRANTPAALKGLAQEPTKLSNARLVATQLLVDELKANWTRSPEIIVARNMQDMQIPQLVRDYDAQLKSQGSDGEARGFIYKGKVYLLADQLNGPAQIAEVLFHEVLGHYGLRGSFGDGLTPVLQQIGTMRRSQVLAKAREYGMVQKGLSDADTWAAMSARDRLSAAEEVLAEMAQSTPEIGFVQRAIAAIRTWLRANVPGFKALALTDDEIVRSYILPARGYVTRSDETPQQSLQRALLAFDRGSQDNPAMFSRASMAGLKASALDSAGQAIKSVTATNLKERAGFKLTDYLGIGLQALGRRQIVDIYGDMLPMAEYNRLVQQMEADKNEGGAEADQLVTRWAKLSDEGKLANLMHDATLAQIDPAKPYEEGDDKAKYTMLRGQFDALTDAAKQVYTDTRDSYQAHHAKVRSAIKERIERSELKGERKRALLEQMDGEFFKAVKGVYFPLARFGQYAVTVKGPDGKVESVSRAETKAEAEALRSSLLSAFPRDKGFTVGRVMLSKDFIADRDAVGRGFMTELYQVLDKQDMDATQRAELEDTLGQLYLSSLPDLSWAKHGIHRKGTPGFSQDARRAFAQNMFHGSRYLAKLRYSDLMQDELSAMQKHVDDWREVPDFDQNTAQRVVDELNKRHESLMNPKSSPLSTALTSFGFIFHLGLSPASALVNLSQTALVAYPIMGAKWGFGKASAALLKASQQAAKGKNDITGALNAEERAAYDEAVRAGTIDVTMAHDLAGIAQGEDAGVMWKIRPVMRWASFLFHHAERFNRQVTFVAAYRLARESGADQKLAFEQATKATYDGHFDYGAANRPRIMQGNVAKVLLLFKQYGQNMVYTLARNAQQAIKAETPEARAQARKALGGLLATHAAAAGVLGLPMVTTLLAAASMVGGDDDEPWDAKVALQNMLADTFGQKTAEVLAHGLSRLTPWDISGRVGLDKLIFPDVQEGLEGQRLAESAMAAALGPVAGIGVNLLKGMQMMSEGRYAMGLEAMMPAALRGPVKSIRYANEGVQDKSGISILDEVSPAAVAGQFLGFSPSEARNAQEGKSAIVALDRALGERRQELLAKIAKATMAKDEEAKVEAREEIKRFNEKNPGRRINPNHIMASVRNRQKRIDQAQDGVYLPRNRRDAMDAGRFAVSE